MKYSQQFGDILIVCGPENKSAKTFDVCEERVGGGGPDEVLRSFAVDASEVEDVRETSQPVTETGDHGRRPKLPSKPQTSMRTNEKEPSVKYVYQ